MDVAWTPTPRRSQGEMARTATQAPKTLTTMTAYWGSSSVPQEGLEEGRRQRDDEDELAQVVDGGGRQEAPAAEERAQAHQQQDGQDP